MPETVTITIPVKTAHMLRNHCYHLILELGNAIQDDQTSAAEKLKFSELQEEVKNLYGDLAVVTAPQLQDHD